MMPSSSTSTSAVVLLQSNAVPSSCLDAGCSSGPCIAKLVIHKRAFFVQKREVTGDFLKIGRGGNAEKQVFIF